MEKVTEDLPKIEHTVQSKSYIKINNLSKLEAVPTKTILVREHFWMIKFCRADETDDASLKLDFFLKDGQEATFDWAIIAELSVKVVSKKYSEEKLCANSGPRLFSLGEENSHSVLIQWKDLIRPESGYVIDDACIFEIKLKTSPIQSVSTNEWMKFDIDRECCDRALNAKFMISINNLTESYGICSPKFLLDDTPWRILFWKEKDLQIFILNEGKVSSDYLRLASIYCKLISNNGEDRKLVKKAKFHQSAMEHLVSFMPWNELWKEGFMKNGAFDIEIEIKIKSPDEPATASDYALYVWKV